MTTSHQIDKVDLQILNCLLENSIRSHKEIGHVVRLTGQAVGARIRKLQEVGLIEGFTIRWNPEKLGQTIHAFITVYMKTSTTDHQFHSYVQSNSKIAEVHRVTSEGCYWLRAYFHTQSELDDCLNELLHYGNYKISLSIERLK